MDKFMLIPRNVLFSILLVAVLFISASAQDTQKMADFVSNIADEVISIIESKDDNKQKQEKLNVIFCKSVDIDWMGKFALGRYYRKLSQKQLQEYLMAYRNFLISTYVPKFTHYNDQSVFIESIKVLPRLQYIVNTKIINPKNTVEQISVAYRIKDFGDKCQIRDIIAEGFSIIIGQKSDFDSIISKEGISSLIHKLQNKVQA